MSYEKHVYPARLPDDLLSQWTREIERHGLSVEFHPAFELSTWEGGYLPCQLTVQPGACPASGRYGSEPLSAGFELVAVLDPEEIAETLDEYEEEMEADGDPLPRSLLQQLKAAPAMVCFTLGGFTWSAAEFRACWFAAAALAKITDGLLFDEWSNRGNHGYGTSDQALLAAASESAAYEEDPDSQESAWNLARFEAWEA